MWRRESFDIKPALTKYAGKSVDETPYKDLFQQDKLLKGLVGINPSHVNRKELMAGYKKYGECGLEVGDWFANVAECVPTIWRSSTPCGLATTGVLCRHSM